MFYYLLIERDDEEYNSGTIFVSELDSEKPGELFLLCENLNKLLKQFVIDINKHEFLWRSRKDVFKSNIPVRIDMKIYLYEKYLTYHFHEKYVYHEIVDLEIIKLNDLSFTEIK